MDSQHEIQPLASKLISGSLMSKYSTSCAVALTTKIRFLALPNSARRSPQVLGIAAVAVVLYKAITSEEVNDARGATAFFVVPAMMSSALTSD
jgi:hypothetical protein